ALVWRLGMGLRDAWPRLDFGVHALALAWVFLEVGSSLAMLRLWLPRLGMGYLGLSFGSGCIGVEFHA
ncbi:hypothetical protein PIB30_095970, partial [Stylosanthes scabra]|nr:hypothetical protein [Stylosanthes scabra]